jgi:hypothetical protein
MSAGIDPALLERALASAMSQQLTLLTDLQDEVISLKSAITQHSPHLTGVPGETQNQQAGSTGDTAAVQAAVQSLSADVASLRREMAEEVAASAKQVRVHYLCAAAFSRASCSHTRLQRHECCQQRQSSLGKHLYIGTDVHAFAMVDF